jgi:mannonate dehydratase
MSRPKAPQVKIAKQLADVSDQTLRFFRQIGVEGVGVPARLVTEVRRSRPHVPPAQNGPGGRQPPSWDADELQRVCDRVREAGLTPATVTLPVSGALLLGRPERDDDLERIRHCIRAAGSAGLRVLTYSFTALRASAGYYAMDGAGRGGAHLRGFDFDRVRAMPVIPDVGEHSREAMWERLTYFLRAAVPEAAAAGVRLALHPNDPPVESFRGVGQPVRSLADLKRLVAVVDNPANSLFLDTGVLTEMAEDVPAAIRYFGARDRIGFVHFRNVRVEVPYERYVETFLDEGDGNPAAWMRAFYESGYTGALEPDHTPGIDGDTTDTWIGWAFAVGQILALRNAAEAELRRST